MTGTRRDNGDGEIRPRANGTWEARVAFIDPMTGALKRKSVYGKTKGAVKVKLKEVQARLADGQPASNATITLEKWAAQWIDTALEASSRKENTKALYASLIRKHIAPTRLGQMQLDRIKPSSIDGWVLELRGRTKTERVSPTVTEEVRLLADSSIVRCFQVLRVCIDGAVRDGLLGKNPVHSVKTPTLPRKEALFMSADQVSQLLMTAEGSRYWTLFAFIAATGTRKGEALGLRWEDVDFELGTATIRRTLYRLKGELRTSSPKSAKSSRVLRPAPELMAELEAARRQQRKDQMLARNVWQDSGFVFTTELGGPMDPRNSLRAFKVAAATAGLPAKVTLHTLRHSAATTMLDDGIHLKAVSNMLGHAGVQITGDTYSHVSRQTEDAAMTSMGKVLPMRRRSDDDESVPPIQRAIGG